MMIWAIYSDITSYTLTNKLCLSVVLLYPVYLIAAYSDGAPPPLQTILMSLSIALIIFMVCIGCFALNIMGGGDVKLIPAVAIWAGTAHVLNYLLITSVVGGLIATLIIIKNRIKASKYNKSSENINLSVAKKNTNAVPYGVGIAVGGLYVAYQLFSTMNYKAT